MPRSLRGPTRGTSEPTHSQAARPGSPPGAAPRVGDDELDRIGELEPGSELDLRGLHPRVTPTLQARLRPQPSRPRCSRAPRRRCRWRATATTRRGASAGGAAWRSRAETLRPSAVAPQTASKPAGSGVGAPLCGSVCTQIATASTHNWSSTRSCDVRSAQRAPIPLHHVLVVTSARKRGVASIRSARRRRIHRPMPSTSTVDASKSETSCTMPRQPVEPRPRVGADVGQPDVPNNARHPPLAHRRTLPGRRGPRIRLSSADAPRTRLRARRDCARRPRACRRRARGASSRFPHP